jgi:hypothetical protein
MIGTIEPFAGLSVTSFGTRLQLSWFLSMLVVSATMVWSVSADVDPGEDFGGYVQEMERREREEHLYEAKLNAHEHWRQTTWAGFFVRKTFEIGKHFEPFLIAIRDALDETSTDESGQSLAKIMTYIGIRMLLVIGLLSCFYVAGKIIQLLIGGDYEIVEEIVIVHEHESEKAAAKARAATTRGKKQKSS